MAEDQTPTPEVAGIKDIFDSTPEEIIAVVNEKVSDYIKRVAHNLEIPSHEWTSPANLSDDDLFNLFFAFEFLTRTDEGKALAVSLEPEYGLLQEALIAEMEDRTGLQYGGPELIGL